MKQRAFLFVLLCALGFGSVAFAQDASILIDAPSSHNLAGDAFSTLFVTITNNGPVRDVALQTLTHRREPSLLGVVDSLYETVHFEAGESVSVPIRMHHEYFIGTSIPLIISARVNGFVVAEHLVDIINVVKTARISYIPAISVLEDTYSEHAITIENTGSAELFVFDLSGSLADGKRLRLQSTNVRIDPGKSTSLPLLLDTADVVPGVYDFTLLVYADGELAAKKTHELRVLPGGVALTTAKTEYVTYEDRILRESFTFKNTQDAAITYDFELEDVQGNLSRFNYVSLEQTRVVFDAKETKTLTLIFSAPLEFSTPYNTLKLVAYDDTRVIFEHVFDVVVYPKRDIHHISITDVLFDRITYFPGDAGTITLTVTNDGDFSERVSAGFTLGPYVSLQSALSSLISAHTSARITLPLDIPHNVYENALEITFLAESLGTSAQVAHSLPIAHETYDFIMRLNSHHVDVIEVGDEVSRDILITNTGNVPDSYAITANARDATLELRLITLEPGERKTVPFLFYLTDAFGFGRNSVSVSVCSLSTDTCASDAFVFNHMSAEDEPLHDGVFASLVTSEQSVEPAKAGVYTIRMFNNKSSSSTLSVEVLVPPSGFDVHILPADTLTLGAFEELEAYVYVTTTRDVGAGTHVLSLVVSNETGNVFEKELNLVVLDDGNIITGFVVSAGKPVILALPVLALLGVVVFLYLRRSNGKTEVSDFEKFYT
ncbi:hypothetical protein COT72_00030 [archaeon CG10_big_fil_rev_8_21_14_0_10_43_11]|nr:MAG: hypothetical protein COT72_00030 [archaeon CG10_big_fil_rev_8_21_14_0_10_43_11]